MVNLLVVNVNIICFIDIVIVVYIDVGDDNIFFYVGRDVDSFMI